MYTLDIALPINESLGSVAVSHLFLTHEKFETPLIDELLPATAQCISPRMIVSDASLSHSTLLAFARQTLPNAQPISLVSINNWADRIIEDIFKELPDHQPWRLHVWPDYGQEHAGQNRCELIRAAVIERLKKRRRRTARLLSDEFVPFSPETSLVQCLLTSPETGWLSVSAAPQPLQLRAIMSPFTQGYVPWAEDRNAPSRAFAKLVEAEQHLGHKITEGQTCVDLGASPGSWSYVALQRGAYVTAIDRSELREDLMRHPRLKFEATDAFKYKPQSPVDWLVCDVIAAPQRSIDLLLEWLAEACMRHFVVTIKFKGGEDYGVLDQLKKEAPQYCGDFRLKRLCANKNEVSAFGSVIVNDNQ